MLGVTASHYSIFSLFLSKGFVERFKKFKDAFDEWMKEGVRKLVYDLQEKVEESDPNEIVNFILGWTKKKTVVENILDEYNELNKTIKYIIFLFGASAITSFFSVYYPGQFQIGDTLATWIQISYFTAFLGICVIFYHLFNFNKLNSRISRFELGTSIEDIIEEELKKEE